jgi:hypothetical protein
VIWVALQFLASASLLAVALSSAAVYSALSSAAVSATAVEMHCFSHSRNQFPLFSAAHAFDAPPCEDSSQILGPHGLYCHVFCDHLNGAMRREEHSKGNQPHAALFSTSSSHRRHGGVKKIKIILFFYFSLVRDGQTPSRTALK